MKEKTDLRVQKTYDSLTTALQELLQEKAFEEITVKELCEKARVRTATFYSHFDDKYDFFFFMLKQLRRSFAAEVEKNENRSHVADYYTELLCSGMNYLEQHEKMANSIWSSSMLVGMMHLMQDAMTDELKKHLQQDFAVYQELQNPELMVQFLLGGMNQVTEWWFTNQKNLKKEAVLADMKMLLENRTRES